MYDGGGGGLIDWANPIADHPLTRGLAGWWLVGDGSPFWGTPLLRDLVSDAHGTLTGGAGWTGALGRPGGNGAVTLDNVDGYVAMEVSGLTVGANLSIGCWYYPRTTTAYEVPWGTNAGGNFNLIVSGGGGGTKPITYVWNDVGSEYNLDTGLTLTTGGWNFVALTITPTDAFIYRWNDASGWGSYQDTKAQGSEDRNGTWRAGRDVGASHIDGLLDDLTAFNRSLSGDEWRGWCWQSRRGHPDTLRRLGRTRHCHHQAAPAAGQPMTKRWQGVPHMGGHRRFGTTRSV